MPRNLACFRAVSAPFSCPCVVQIPCRRAVAHRGIFRRAEFPAGFRSSLFSGFFQHLFQMPALCEQVENFSRCPGVEPCEDLVSGRPRRCGVFRAGVEKRERFSAGVFSETLRIGYIGYIGYIAHFTIGECIIGFAGEGSPVYKSRAVPFLREERLFSLRPFLDVFGREQGEVVCGRRRRRGRVFFLPGCLLRSGAVSGVKRRAGNLVDAPASS